MLFFQHQSRMNVYRGHAVLIFSYNNDLYFLNIWHVWLRYKQNLFYLHMILQIQVICFSYLLSIVLSPAVLDGPEWNAITCTQKQEKTIFSTILQNYTLSTMQLCCLILHCRKCLFWNGHLQSLAIKCLKRRSLSVQVI